ncbi:hypothetical protein RRG08_038323 [Elysia crispata]|uniref:Uncharacterized protein n=1 Tax=Elysia crispata TaxID=231223 RepID=A0AAE1ANA6_9GAST|nr:hypothetical protein RRG08_038323 [Elysia crispata]
MRQPNQGESNIATETREGSMKDKASLINTTQDSPWSKLFDRPRSLSDLQDRSRIKDVSSSLPSASGVLHS